MDNIIRRRDKKAWGFTQNADGTVGVGKPNDSDTDDIRTSVKGEESRGNGGGFPNEDEVTFEYLSSLTGKELRALAKEHDISLDAKQNAAVDKVRAELIEYYDVKPQEEEVPE